MSQSKKINEKQRPEREQLEARSQVTADGAVRTTTAIANMRLMSELCWVKTKAISLLTAVMVY